MYTGASQLFQDTVRAGGGQWYGWVEAWYNGSQLTFDGEYGQTTTHLPLHRGGQNQVQVTGGTPGVRRTLTVTCPHVPGLWDKLAPIGTELHAYTAIRYLDGSVESIPQGVFGIDVEKVTYQASGTMQLTCPDRWARIQRAEFLTPREFVSGTSTATQIASLITEVLTTLTVTNTSGSTATLPSSTEDRDRAGFIQKAATAASLDVYFDRSGNPVIRAYPTIASTGVWTVDPGDDGGVFISADRTRDRQKTRNLIVVNGTGPDGPLIATQYVWDNNSSSPTYAGSGTGAGSTPPDPSTAGPFGQVPFRYTSPLLISEAMAQTAGATLLAKLSGLNAQIDLTSVPLPFLDDGDTITVTYPRERADLARVSERHIIDSMTVPLIWHNTPMQITTRSTVADLPES